MSSLHHIVPVLCYGLLGAACYSTPPGMLDAAPVDAWHVDAQAACGNGVRDQGEECDREDLGGATCASLGFGSGHLACIGGWCRLDVTGCSYSPTCGDRVVDALEECDDGNAEPWDGCTACLITEFRIESDVYHFCGSSGVATGADDGVLVAWEGCFCGEDPCWCYLFGRRLDAQARFLGTDFEIPTGIGHEQRDPAVAPLPGGGYATVWLNEGWGPEVEGISGQRLAADGAELGSSFRVDTAPGGQAGPPAVGALLTGFLVVWSQTTDGGASSMLAQGYLMDGTLDGSPVPVVDDPADLGSRPAVATGADGHFVVVWELCGDRDGDGCGIFGRGFGPDHSPSTAPFQVNATAAGDQRHPDVARLPGDGFVVVWQSGGQDGDLGGIYGRRFLSDATPDGDETPINVETGGDQSDPALAANGDGRILVVWKDTSELYGDEASIVGRLFLSEGTPAGAPMRINHYTAGYPGLPSIANTGASGFLVVWHGSQGFFEGGLFGQRFNADGIALGVGP